jgi:hypothetical protein
MAIALILTSDVIGRLGFSALGQIPGTTPWNYAVLLYASINIAAIITPKVKQPMGLVTLGLMTVHTMTTYAAAFGNMTIGLMALSVGKSWGGIFLIVGGINLIATSNRLCQLVQNFRRA